MNPYIILGILLTIAAGSALAARLLLPHKDDWDKRGLITVVFFAAGAGVCVWILYTGGG
jgi:hypothetical protein